MVDCIFKCNNCVMSMYISIDFCRIRVIRTTFKHINSDLETFLGSAKLDAMRKTLKGHANKMVIIMKDFSRKQDWV